VEGEEAVAVATDVTLSFLLPRNAHQIPTFLIEFPFYQLSAMELERRPPRNNSRGTSTRSINRLASYIPSSLVNRVSSNRRFV